MNHWTEVQLVRPQPRMKRSVLTAFVTTVDVSSPGRDASHYSWTGRDCDVLLFIVMMRLLEIEHSEGPFTIALVVGLATHIDGFIITTAIPERRHDVHTIANVFEKPCRDLWNAIYGNRNTNIEYQLRGRLRYSVRAQERRSSVPRSCPRTRASSPSPYQRVRSDVAEQITSDMPARTPEQIDFVHSITLEPADVIATGTPAGVGCRRELAVVVTTADLTEVRNRTVRDRPSVGCRSRAAPRRTIATPLTHSLTP